MERIRVYTGGIVECNGYLFRTGDNTYIAIDAPSGFAEWVQVNKPDAIITDLLLTHQHFDHIQGTAELKRCFGCKVHAFAQYDGQLTLESLARNAWNMDLKVEPFEVDDVLGEEVHVADWGGLIWHIHYVPGHTADSLVYQLVDDDILFSGDVLFAGSIGRTDLPGGSLTQLVMGINTKIMNQPANTTVFPGHGHYTTVRNELLTNPFLA